MGHQVVSIKLSATASVSALLLCSANGCCDSNSAGPQEVRFHGVYLYLLRRRIGSLFWVRSYFGSTIRECIVFSPIKMYSCLFECECIGTQASGMFLPEGARFSNA